MQYESIPLWNELPLPDMIDPSLFLNWLPTTEPSPPWYMDPSPSMAECIEILEGGNA